MKQSTHLFIIFVPTQRGEWISGSGGAHQSEHCASVDRRPFFVTRDGKPRRWICRKTNKPTLVFPF